MCNLSMYGLVLNTVGSIFLAFSLNRTTRMLNTSITALEHFKDTFLRKGDVLSFTGLEIHRKSALKSTSILTLTGVLFLIAGFSLQLISLFINN